MAHVLATSAALPDEEFATLAALARHIVALRDKRAAGFDIHLGPAIVGRDAIPNGVAIAVRLRDGSSEGRGQLVGYAFCEFPERRDGRDHEFNVKMQDRLMAALAAAAPRLPLHRRAA